MEPENDSPKPSANETSSKRTLKDVVCSVLDIDPAEFSNNVPLTSYGLDSLSAASLSHALEPGLKISQLRLLADLTLIDLEQLQEKWITAHSSHNS